jgi:tetratricopeptide (TPR) repeat protein/TolB-like protein
MAPEDGTRDNDEARKKLLEEIRKRAEEAELRRLEEEGASPNPPGRRPRPDRGQSPPEPRPPKPKRELPEDFPPPPLFSNPTRTEKADGADITPTARGAGGSPSNPELPDRAWTGGSGEALPPAASSAGFDAIWGPPREESSYAAPDDLADAHSGSGAGEHAEPTSRADEAASDLTSPSEAGSRGPTGGSTAHDDVRIAELRDRFSLAIDAHDAGAARAILEECSTLEMEPSEMTAMRLILERLEGDVFADQARAHEEPFASTPEPEHPEEAEPPTEPLAPAQPEIPTVIPNDPGRINELLHQAEFSYQHERYAAAMETLTNVLSMDPGNEEARTLLQQVERAHELTERIAEEDARSRETMHAPPVDAAPQKPVSSDAEVWGSSVRALAPDMMEPAAEQEAPVPKRTPRLKSNVLPALSGITRVLKPLATVVLVAAVVAVGYYLVRRVTSTVAPSRVSVVILPAATTGGNPSLARLAEGFSDDVIRELGMVADLRVIAPVSSSSAAGSSWSPPQIARAVGANLCLTWTFSDDQSVVRLDQSLFDSSGSSPAWTNVMTFPDSLLNVERSEVLDQLLKAAGVRASEEEQVALHKIPTTRVDAYRSYLRGRSILRHRDVYPISDAVAEFEHAIALDSLFAEAYASLGWSRVLAYERGDTAGDPMADAIVCVQRAVSLGFRNAETFRAWGAIEYHEGNYDKASERFEQAVQIAPSDADARRRIAFVQAVRGDLDEALASAKRALLDDPLNPDSYILLGLLQKYAAIANNDNAEEFTSALTTFRQGESHAADRSDFASRYVAEILWYRQDPDDAVAILTDHVARTRQSYESLYMLGRVQQAAGRPKQEWQEILSRSKEALQNEIKKKPGNPVLLSWLGLVQTRLGEFKDALANARQALSAAPRNNEVLYNVARLYSLQRNTKESLDYLRKAVDQRYDLAEVLDMDFFNLHGDQDYLKSVVR